MYIPKHNREDDLTTLQSFMQNYPFAILVARQNGDLVASHIPLTYDPQAGQCGTLFGHVALGNQQWKVFDDSQEVLAIFQGPHTYISASWYEMPEKSVPTWNYAVVHVYGSTRRLTQDELFQHLAALTGMFEREGGEGWQFRANDEMIQRMAKGVVGFALPITRLEGKYKLSQNRSQNDQRRVIQALNESTGTPEQEVSSLMQTRLQEHEG